MIYDLNRSSVSAELSLGAAAASATATLLAGTSALHQISERIAALMPITTLLRRVANTSMQFTLRLIATLLRLVLRRHILLATATATAATTLGPVVTTRLTRTLGRRLISLLRLPIGLLRNLQHLLE